MAFIQLPVLDERSVFHLVEENFKSVDLKTYAIRMIYCGEHTLPKKDMLKYFRKSVTKVNASYCEINVYGLVLVYEHHFIHIIEGSEDTVHRQLRFLFQAEQDYIKEMIQKDKEEQDEEKEGEKETERENERVMEREREKEREREREKKIEKDKDNDNEIENENINENEIEFENEIEQEIYKEQEQEEEQEREKEKRKRKEKDKQKLERPTILEDSSPESERVMFRRLKMLIVYHSIRTRFFTAWRGFLANPATLVSNLNAWGPIEEHMEQLRVCLEKIGRFCNLAATEEDLSFETMKTGDSRMEVLPEVGLLDYLLSSAYIFDLREVFQKHRRVDDLVLYNELVWPLPNHFTPRQLYKLKIDDSFVEPLPVMPWELITKEEKDEEEGLEKEEDSDSS